MSFVSNIENRRSQPESPRSHTNAITLGVRRCSDARSSGGSTEPVWSKNETEARFGVQRWQDLKSAKRDSGVMPVDVVEFGPCASRGRGRL